MNKLRRIKKVLGTRGLYITAALSLTVMAGAGVFAYNKAMDEVGQSFELNIPEKTITEQAEAKKSDVTKPDTKTDKTKTQSDTDKTDDEK